MRVNVDSQALRDPRFRRAARRLNVSHHEVLARCISVWMVCYERREAVIPREDIEIASELEGFTDALVSAELADLVDDRDVYVRGVSERIAFLEKQSERGKKSGEVRRAVSDNIQKRTSVQQTFDLPLNQGAFNGRSRVGSTTARTNSPDQDLDLDLRSRNSQENANVSAAPVLRAVDNSIAQESADGDPPPGHVKTENVEPVANENGSTRRKREPPELPDQAYTLAHLLLAQIIANNPRGRTANLPQSRQDETAQRWAVTIDKLHRLDGQSWGAIEGMIMWSQRDGFWRGVILGADNLRDKWDKMTLQRDRAARDRPTQRRGPTELALEELEQLEAAARAKGSTP